MSKTASYTGSSRRHRSFEIFHDPGYFDMWALRPVGRAKLNETIHFTSKRAAEHAAVAIAAWYGEEAQVYCT